MATFNQRWTGSNQEKRMVIRERLQDEEAKALGLADFKSYEFYLCARDKGVFDPLALAQEYDRRRAELISDSARLMVARELLLREIEKGAA